MDTKQTAKKGQLSRQRLLDAATKLFAEQGFQATKVSEIVKAAGLTQAAFYLYFSSKEEILSELVGQFKHMLLPLADAGKLVTSLPGKEVPIQVQENVRNILMFVGAHPELTRIALSESAEGDQIKQEIIQLIAKNLKQNQQIGHIRRDLPVEAAAECMLAVLEHFTGKIIREKVDIQAISDGITNVLLFGLLAERGVGSE